MGVLAAVWGASYLFIKVALDDGLDPFFIVLARIALGALVLVPIAIRRDAFATLRGSVGRDRVPRRRAGRRAVPADHVRRAPHRLRPGGHPRLVGADLLGAARRALRRRGAPARDRRGRLRARHPRRRAAVRPRPQRRRRGAARRADGAAGVARLRDRRAVSQAPAARRAARRRRGVDDGRQHADAAAGRARSRCPPRCPTCRRSARCSRSAPAAPASRFSSSTR